MTIRNVMTIPNAVAVKAPIKLATGIGCFLILSSATGRVHSRDGRDGGLVDTLLTIKNRRS